MTHWRLFLMTVLLFFLLFFLQYRLWYERDGVFDLIKLKKKLNDQIILNDDLKKQNDLLLAQINQLQSSEEVVESRARHELGMIKKNETYYQFVK